MFGTGFGLAFSYYMVLFIDSTYIITSFVIERLKVETQLLSWIQKYDLEMTEKQLELDDFTEKFDNQVEECSKLQVIITLPIWNSES